LQFNPISLILGIFFLFFFTACSSKNPSIANNHECGAGTVIQSASIGALIGSVTGKLLQNNILVGAVIGGVAGGFGGIKLANMQCEYYGQEKSLLKKVQSNIKSQNSLAQQTNGLNQKISQLYHKISLLKHSYQSSLEKKQTLLDDISIKEKEVLNIQSLNNNVLKKTKQYYKELKEKQYSQQDREKVERSLKSILSSLSSIKKSCIYNLKQLNKFKAKVL